MATDGKKTENEPPSVAALIGLCNHRWAIPVTAHLFKHRGTKFVTLHKAIGIPRATLARTLDALVENDLVLRNPGHGHPMRPEYLLTPFGEAIGPSCASLIDLIDEFDLAEVAGRKWSLPAICIVSHGTERFVEIGNALPGVTPRALTNALKSLESSRLVDRKVSDDHPPAVRYTATTRGRAIADATDALATALQFD